MLSSDTMITSVPPREPHVSDRVKCAGFQDSIDEAHQKAAHLLQMLCNRGQAVGFHWTESDHAADAASIVQRLRVHVEKARLCGPE
jgi:hypothetical protein